MAGREVLELQVHARIGRWPRGAASMQPRPGNLAIPGEHNILT